MMRLSYSHILLLFIEPLVSADKPQYSDYPEELFEERMTGHGFWRSRQKQMEIVRYGLCSELDGYNNVGSNSTFGRDDAGILRRMVVQSLIRRVEKEAQDC